MDYEIRPEPTPPERDALAKALDRLLAGSREPAPYRSRWRETGIRENVALDEARYATARPRRSPGARSA